MATTWELCFKLGFGDGPLCARGPSALLLNPIKEVAKEFIVSKLVNDSAFLDSKLVVKEVQRVTHFYLNVNGAGKAHWGLTLFNGHWKLLEWPLNSVL